MIMIETKSATITIKVTAILQLKSRRILVGAGSYFISFKIMQNNKGFCYPENVLNLLFNLGSFGPQCFCSCCEKACFDLYFVARYNMTPRVSF